MSPSLKKFDFEQRVLALCDTELLYHSRVHPIPSFNNTSRQVFVKREDESGFGISGAKKRKYASLIPYLKNNRIPKVILIGGSRSNNIAGLVQLLHENRIAYELFLKKEHQKELTGNRLLLHLLTDESNIRWIEKSFWAQVETYAQAEALKTNSFVIPEGGTCQAAFPGACTLGLDILEEAPFDYVWIDSGTALMAGAIIEVLRLFSPETQIQVIQMAGNDDYFQSQQEQFHLWMEKLADVKLPFHTNFNLRFPLVGKSFGSVGATTLNFIKDFARTEGILTDPIYSGKLFYTAQQVMREEDITGRHLIVHSGGGMGLMGRWKF